MKARVDVDEEKRIFELAELLSNLTPDMIRAMQGLANGIRTGRGIARQMGLKLVDAQEGLWEMVCMGLVASDKPQDLYMLTDKGASVWRALKELLRPASKQRTRR